MSRGLADTSVFIARESGLPVEAEALPDELAVSVITIGELRAGVLAARTVDVRNRRLATLTAALELDPVRWTRRSRPSELDSECCCATADSAWR